MEQPGATAYEALVLLRPLDDFDIPSALLHCRDSSIAFVAALSWYCFTSSPGHQSESEALERQSGLDRRITRQSRHAVEVVVVAGQHPESAVLHHSHDEGVAAQETVALAQRSSCLDQGQADRQNLDAKTRDIQDGLAKLHEFLNLGWLL